MSAVDAVTEAEIAAVSTHMARLTAHPDRHVGGVGNRAATGYFAEVMSALGVRVSRHELPCLEWIPGRAWLEVAGERTVLEVGPYSLACHLEAPLVAVSTVEQLESLATRDAIVLLHGPLASGQVMPRNFTFYNPESHRRIYRALDAFPPAGIVAATGRDPEMVGSQYPFPLFEDGDLDIPNAYTTDVVGEHLRSRAGEQALLHSDSARLPATAEHVVASLPGTGPGRIVISAHIDSRRGSPGALDNASGVATLLAVAALLKGYAGVPTIEFVPFNGEDDYANPGEMRWVEENRGRFDEIICGINIDDSGQIGAPNHVSFYDCPAGIEDPVREVMASYPGIAEGPQWFQGDHSILGLYGRPAIAIASAEMVSFMSRYAHTERDTVDLADTALIAETVRFVATVIRRLSEEHARV